MHYTLIEKEIKMTINKQCPFLEIQLCGYCSLFPVKKMIPVEKMKESCMCLSENYINCGQFIEARGKALNFKEDLVGSRKIHARK